MEESNVREQNPKGLHSPSGWIWKSAALSWRSHALVCTKYGKLGRGSNRMGGEVTAAASVLNACDCVSCKGSKIGGCISQGAALTGLLYGFLHALNTRRYYVNPEFIQCLTTTVFLTSPFTSTLT